MPDKDTVFSGTHHALAMMRPLRGQKLQLSLLCIGIAGVCICGFNPTYYYKTSRPIFYSYHFCFVFSKTSHPNTLILVTAANTDSRMHLKRLVRATW